MQQFHLNISLGNAAFGDTPAIEVARILRHIATRLDAGAKLENGGTIGDHNGNTVGHWGAE